MKTTTTEELDTLLSAEADALTAQEQQELIDAVLRAEEAYTQEVTELELSFKRNLFQMNKRKQQSQMSNGTMIVGAT